MCATGAAWANADKCHYARKQNRIREYMRKSFLMSCDLIITKHVQYNMSSFSIGIETPSPDTGSLLVSEKLWRSFNPYRKRRHIILDMFSDYWIAGHEETFTCIFSYSILLPSVMAFVGVHPVPRIGRFWDGFLEIVKSTRGRFSTSPRGQVNYLP